MSRRFQRLKKSKGFVLIAAAMSITVLAGVTGMAVDLGRIYITKNELQTYTDAAALAASLELNGLDSGITAANAVIDTLPNYWNFGTDPVPAAARTISYAETSDATTWWTAPDATQAGQAMFVKVRASVPLKMYLIPAVKGAGSTFVEAESIGGKVESTTMAAYHLIPLSPIAPNPADAVNFGFVHGSSYDLRWSSNIGNSGEPPAGSVCAGDLALGWAAGSTIAKARDAGSDRGWWGSQSVSSINTWIDQGYPFAISVGDFIGMTGTKNGTRDAMVSRVNSDTDHVSETFAAYEGNRTGTVRLGNGRRIVAVPVTAGPAATVGNGNGNGNGNGDTGGYSAAGSALQSDDNANGTGTGNDNDNGNGNGNGNTTGGEGNGNGTFTSNRQVLGFAAFFLDNLNYADTNGNEPYCGQYIGTYVPGANAHSGGKGGLAKVRLVK